VTPSVADPGDTITTLVAPLQRGGYFTVFEIRGLFKMHSIALLSYTSVKQPFNMKYSKEHVV